MTASVLTKLNLHGKFFVITVYRSRQGDDIPKENSFRGFSKYFLKDVLEFKDFFQRRFKGFLYICLSGQFFFSNFFRFLTLKNHLSGVSQILGVSSDKPDNLC